MVSGCQRGQNSSTPTILTPIPRVAGLPFYRARSYGLPYAAAASAPIMQIRPDMAALQKA